MEYTANGTALPVVGLVECDVYTPEGIKRAGLRLTLEGVPTAKQMKALLEGCVEVAEDGAVFHRAEGYTEVLDCVVTLARPDASQAMIQEASEKLEAVSGQHVALARLAASFILDDEAMEHAAVWPEWAAGAAYRKGEIVRRGDGLYRVEQAHTAQGHQAPDGAGMLAVYRPIQQAAQGGEVLPWVYGEAVAVGDRREHDGVVYECYTAAGANVHSPDLVASVWRVVG